MPWLFCQEVPFRAELPVIPTGLESSAQNVTNRELPGSQKFRTGWEPRPSSERFFPRPCGRMGRNSSPANDSPRRRLQGLEKSCEETR